MPDFKAQLLPFNPKNSPAINVHCQGTFPDPSTVNVSFSLSGDLKFVSIDTPVNKGKRTDNLWQKTCFEIFIKNAANTSYWEYNLSPTAHWAIYGFNDYRSDRFDELSVNELSINSELSADEFLLSSQLALPTALVGQNLEIGLSTVVQVNNGDIYYYALNHPCEQPDFHHAAGFTIFRKTL